MKNPIASDDPQAAQKLSDRIAALEELQTRMSAANKLVRKHKDDRRAAIQPLIALGFTEANAHKLFEPDYGGRIGFAAYELTNNNSNIRRLKQRLASIQEHANDVTSSEEVNGITITDNVEAFRVQIAFNGKPSEDVRSFLKSCGFRWAPSVGFWQAHRSARALWRAREACNMVKPPVVTMRQVAQFACPDDTRFGAPALTPEEAGARREALRREALRH